ncbi:3-oxoacyl-[acyl-carrier-protein] reductase FabG-like [Tropilaelaps mercedesae]|uniref:3-oxoacyl-[acyl-carrier-protein] reductase FabG-like n=1 Tax=Tropilaelaps mercedesae TaxID=418985 RepID=A0A1V9X758_9ACAR|nr:3-oxoacyl-[acyl-carrier-protein] reductase FabG-like [Tropilaelaps mercedesae]
MPPKTVANAMHGKVFIITGSSSGIGRATAILLASWGSRLTVHGRHVERVEETAKECKKVSPSGQDACTVIGNIEDPEIRKQLIQMTLNTFGRIDGLVSSAGHCAVGGWEHEDVKAMKLMLDVHVVAPYDLCRQMMPELIKNKGSIVMVSSIASLRGVPKLVANTTAKHAMDGMMKALAVETAKQGVRINSVNPGIVKSNTHRCGALDEYQKVCLCILGVAEGFTEES